MLYRFWWIVPLLLLTGARVLHAQTPDLKFEHFRTQHGLPSNSITAIVQDTTGFLWFGTSDGLVRYDGYDFILFQADSTDTTSLSDSRVLSLLADREGNVWAGTMQGGLNRFDPATQAFTRFLPNGSSGFRGNEVHDLYEDWTGRIWATSAEGLFQYQPTSDTFAHFVLPDSFQQNMYTLAEDLDGTLWVGTQHGLAYLDEAAGNVQLYPDHAVLREAPVSSLLADRHNNLWVGTWGKSLFQLSASRSALHHYPSQLDDTSTLSDSTIKTLYEDSQGIIWVGTGGHEQNGGINRLDPATGHISRYERDARDPAALGSNRVWSILEDRSGVFWVGTLYGGLHKYDASQHKFSFVHASATDGLQQHQAMYYYEDRAGIHWMGTWGDGLARVDPETDQLEHYTSSSHGLQHDRVKALLEDRNGHFWVGTFGGGLHRFDRSTEQFEVFQNDPNAPHSLSSDLILTLFEDHAGELWVGTHRGLNRFDPITATAERFLVAEPDNTAPEREQIWAIEEDADQRLWVGTRNGLFRFNRDTHAFTHVSLPASSTPQGKAIKQIERDAEGQFWIVTRENQLFRFDPATDVFAPFRTAEGLLDDAVRAVLLDHSNDVWIGTAKALSRYNLSTQTFRHYDASDGLRDADLLLDFANSTRSGTLFWSNASGYLTFDPDDIRDNTHPPPVALTTFDLLQASPSAERAQASPTYRSTDSSNQPHISVARNIRLPYWQNDVAFGFAALHYSQPDQIQYRYQMINADDGWWYADTQRQAVYTNLEAGDYVFRVQAANHDGVWSQPGASIRVIITPPWWQRAWFRALLLITFMGFIYGGYRLRIRSVTHRNRVLSDEVESRTAEIRQQHLMLEDQHAQLEAQAAQLDELNRIKSRFFANISHEFRTPLTLMLGPVEDALRDPSHALDRAQLQMMRRNGQHLLRLINQLLDLARLEASKMPLEAAPGDLSGFLRALVFSLESLATRKQITLHFTDGYTAQAACYFDPDKLEKAVYNVLSNALKFTPSEGRVELLVQSTLSEKAVYADIVIRDTGPGISEMDLPYVFDRFYQAGTESHWTPGTGVGLALAQELIQLHGGSVTVESTLGKGSVFTIRLPLGRAHLRDDQIVEHASFEQDFPVREDDISDCDIPHQAEQPASSTRATVLIVDDHADVRAYLRRHLASRYRIQEAKTGIEALSSVRTEAPDLILSDVMMPEMDGMTLCSTIKSDPALNHIPVILLTAKAAEASKQEGLHAGADDYIYKPFNAEELLLRAENLIAVRRLLKERFAHKVVMEPSAIPVRSTDAVFLEQVRATVEAEMGNSHFGVAMLADAMALSERQLYRKLNALLEVSPAGFIRTMRLQRAAYLLEHEAGNISEIAYQVGFNNPKYFSRLFRQVFGVAPTTYQQRHLQQQRQETS